MLFRRSTENEWNISQNFTTARAFFTLVGDISRRQVIFHVGR